LGIQALTVAEAPSAIDELLADHGAALLAAARLICLDEQEAQDVVQTTFEIALRRGHTLRDRNALRAWLLAIEARESMRRVRQMRRLSPSSAKRKRLADRPGADECRIVADATSDGNGLGERI